MIYRLLENVVSENLKYFSVITITGPRQSGKTTLIRKMFPEMAYFSLENPDVQYFAKNDPVSFLNQTNKGMVLDEVQNVPQLLSYIQGIVDVYPARKFILSGSSQFSLLHNVTQSLAGRTAVLELLPLSLHEIRGTEVTNNTDELIYSGFYPAIHSGKNIARLFYPAYVRTYLERDVRQLLQVQDIDRFHLFIRLCAGRVGSLFCASELANEVGVAVNTIKSWLSILQASYIVFMLQPYYENTKKRLTKTPKIYFYDTGLACYLLGIERFEQIGTDRMRGHLFENLVISEMLKYRLNKGLETNLTFYRDSNANEIDLLVPTGSRYLALEIKSSQTYNSSFETSFKGVSLSLDERISKRLVVYDGQLENVNTAIGMVNFRNLQAVLENCDSL